MNNFMQNKYNATWLSHSSVSDFLKCPRLYYLRNIWRNKKGNKINIVSPSLSLGLAVHQVLEPLADLKVEERLDQLCLPNTLLGSDVHLTKLLENYEKNWKKFTGKKGGFLDTETEEYYKNEGLLMLKNVIENPGLFEKKTVKFYSGDFIPNIFLDEQENIILCGLVDWVEYLEDEDALRVIDFKTGKNDEREDSMQLYIYKILVEGLQKRKVKCGAYWYLERDTFPKNVELPDEDVNEVKAKLLQIGLDIKKRKSSSDKNETNFKCKYGDTCGFCKNFELIRKFTEGDLSVINLNVVEYVGTGEYKQDLYLIKDKTSRV
jgi:ATP-dependent helicase/DNAse subunit B